MSPSLLALLLAAGQAPVALLPVEAAELPRDSARAASEALAAALPATFRPMETDTGAVREHLAAAGPACRADLECLCAAAELSSGQLALDLAIEPAGAATWAVDLRVLAPCDGRRVNRRAEIVPARLPDLERFLSDTVPALLRGRDLLRPPTTG